jgi:hypothetical protein
MSKICEICGEEFTGRYSKKLCDRCYKRNYYLENKEKIKLNYMKRKDKPTGNFCIECGEEIIGGAKKDMCLPCYHKSWYEKNSKNLDYIIKKKYHDMVQRTKQHNFPNIITREKFYEFANNSPELKKLYEAWVESGYERSLTPSVDRIDNSKGYISGNIQFLTQSENTKKGHVENPPRSIKCKLVKGDEVLYFESQQEASRFLGLSKAMVCLNIKRGCRTTKSGWKAYKLTDEDEEK